eukprot:scaffold16454_cov117-Isochrysis_galbana.AAC.6
MALCSVRAAIAVGTRWECVDVDGRKRGAGSGGAVGRGAAAHLQLWWAVCLGLGRGLLASRAELRMREGGGAGVSRLGQFIRNLNKSYKAAQNAPELFFLVFHKYSTHTQTYASSRAELRMREGGGAGVSRLGQFIGNLNKSGKAAQNAPELFFLVFHKYSTHTQVRFVKKANHSFSLQTESLLRHRHRHRDTADDSGAHTAHNTQ